SGTPLRRARRRPGAAGLVSATIDHPSRHGHRRASVPAACARLVAVAAVTRPCPRSGPGPAPGRRAGLAPWTPRKRPRLLLVEAVEDALARLLDVRQHVLHRLLAFVGHVQALVDLGQPLVPDRVVSEPNAVALHHGI